MLNIFIAGQKYFGQAVLKELAAMEGIKIVGVSAPCCGDRQDRLCREAVKRGLPVIPAGSLNASTLPEGLDLIISAHCHDFISPATIQKTKLGAIGYHPSLLPLHRGRDAVYWAIRMGNPVTGGTVYWLNNKVDGGPIAAQGYVFIRPGDSPFDLWRRDLMPMGIMLFRRVILDLLDGLIVAVPQDEKLATWEPSVGRPPLFRPDLPMIGPGPEGFTVRVNSKALTGNS
ncbi:formyl transferase domain protein [Desulfatibacillum aliphaticivorans]|uniref:Formyl transferase domain protein n=1 Tax=Desulfatibacillum aliphaticivorans TaxID=218208 RepID=B8FC22_DESAL|nr:formyltransferase family protein [Desulfatibacillum aliphaticivorans]ACL05227.1 formyl transferase domain protein [Desulfatibacillum aliphaticivorans]